MACGNPTCSEKCHRNLIDQFECVFHLNFTKEAKNVGLRSFPFQNAAYAERNTLATGTPLAKTSRSFLFPMKHSKIGWVYFQQGYLRYGRMREEVLENLHLLPKNLLDLYMYKRRVCSCECDKCADRPEHPVINCVDDCENSFTQISRDLVTGGDQLNTCSCVCAFCRSSQTINVHKKLDCLEFCFAQKEFMEAEGIN